MFLTKNCADTYDKSYNINELRDSDEEECFAYFHEALSVAGMDGLGYGWLKYNPALADEIAGHYIPRVETKTRVEEYHFVRNNVIMRQPERVFDAAAGYVPEWHKLPLIVADSLPNVLVDAYDMNELSLEMPEHDRVTRTIGRIEDLHIADSIYDCILCISTLEHVASYVARSFIEEAARIARPNAMIILTADNYVGVSPSYLRDLLSPHFDTGRSDDNEDQTQFPGGKRVAYAIGKLRS